MNITLMATVRVLDDVTGAPCKDLLIASSVYYIVIGRYASNVVGVEAADTDQTKMVGTVRVEEATNTSDYNVFLSASNVAHSSRNVVTYVAESSIPPE